MDSLNVPLTSNVILPHQIYHFVTVVAIIQYDMVILPVISSTICRKSYERTTNAKSLCFHFGNHHVVIDCGFGSHLDFFVEVLKVSKTHSTLNITQFVVSSDFREL